MLGRRLITIPVYAIAWFSWIATAPLWILLALVVDLVRRSRGVALRSAGVLTVYLTCEIVGVVISTALWLWRAVSSLDEAKWIDLHFRLEAWWGTTLFRALVQLFGLRLEVESDTDLSRGPYLLMLRHASTCDTVLAAALVSGPSGIRLRYVLKRELLWDPCLDIVGNRLPNVFVDRSSEDSLGEVQNVQTLARDLGTRDGVLIYPEGTRFSVAKRARVIQRFQEQGDAEMLEYATSLGPVLPPRAGGTLGLLEAAPHADVVVCAHAGFEGAASLGAIWNGALLDQVIRVQFRRIPRDEIPTEREAQTAWLLEEWRRVGAFVEENQPARLQ